VGDINIEQQTVFISAEISKNSLDAAVTIPQVVIELINELGIMTHNKDNYVFGEHFATSKKIGHNKMFGNYWDRFINNDSGLCPEFKGKGYCFYSLKGTGITTMLKKGVPSIIVRDQARHQDITTTEIYTKGRNLKAPALLKDYGNE
jgi:integrase